MFADVKAGEKVYSLEYGWGCVMSITNNGFHVQFFNKKKTEFYSFGGVKNNIHHNQTLFWDEVVFEIPKKPKKKVKKWMYIFKKDGEYHIEGHASKIMFFNSKEEIEQHIKGIEKKRVIIEVEIEED